MSACFEAYIFSVQVETPAKQYQISTFQEEPLQFLPIYCHIFGDSEQVLIPPPPSTRPFL
jgi:hypothetical protein